MNRIFSTAALAIFFYFTQLSVLSSQSLTRADTLNIIHYDIHLDIMNFSAKQIKGYTEVTLTPRVNNLNSIKFDLLKMTIDSVIISNDQSIALSVIQLSYNDTLLKINLNKAININDTARLKIY